MGINLVWGGGDREETGLLLYRIWVKVVIEEGSAIDNACVPPRF